MKAPPKDELYLVGGGILVLILIVFYMSRGKTQQTTQIQDPMQYAMTDPGYLALDQTAAHNSLEGIGAPSNTWAVIPAPPNWAWDPRGQLEQPFPYGGGPALPTYTTTGQPV